jgi:hypothetical protein
MDLQEFSKHLDGHRGDSNTSQDAQLENDCIQVLAQLEIMVERLPLNGTDSEFDASLEIAKEMLVVVIDYVTQRFGQDTVAQELRRVCELRDSVRDLQQMLKRGFWKSLLSKKTVDDPLTQHAYRQLGKEFAEVFASVLNQVNDFYQTPAALAEWRAGCGILIDEFQQRW